MRFFALFSLAFGWMNLGVGTIAFRDWMAAESGLAPMGYVGVWFFGLAFVLTGFFFLLWAESILAEAMYSLLTFDPDYGIAVYWLLVALGCAAFLAGAYLFIGSSFSPPVSNLGLALFIDAVLGLLLLIWWSGYDAYWAAKLDAEEAAMAKR